MIYLSTLLVALFVIFGAICDALIDTLRHHYSKSIFNSDKLKERWWNPSESWKNKYLTFADSEGAGLIRKQWGVFGIKFNKPVQITDAFHFFKMWRVVFNILAVVLATQLHFHQSVLNFIVLFVGLGLIRNIFFSFFYEGIFIKED